MGVEHLVAHGSLDAFDPQGRALLDHLGGRRAVEIAVHANDGPSEVVDAAHFFRGVEAMEGWELRALALCHGRILDVGAGAGCHALALAGEGHAGRVGSVVAIDRCAGAVEVMRRRGVADARHATLADVDDGPYDTLLLLMHGLGIAGDIEGLCWMLADAHRLVAPAGQILADSRAPDAPTGHAAPRTPDVRPHPGVRELRLAYEGVVGPPFWWLFVADDELARHAAGVGWRAEVVQREPDGRYLARLVRA